MENLLLGIVTWLSTGVDDLLVILSLMAICERRSRVAIVVGTLLGTAVMFALAIGSAALLSQLLDLFFDDGTNWIGIIPILVSIAIFKNLNEEESGEKETNGPWKMFSMAFVIYIFNMLDDLAVNSALIIEFTDSPQEVALLGAGNIMGASLALASMHLTTSLLRKHKKAVAVIAAMALMSFGVIILLGGGACMAQVLQAN